MQGSAYSQIVAAKRVLDEGGEIVVPAPVWFEMLRGADPQAVASLRGLQGRFRIEPVDAAAAERGAELVRAAIAGPICPACYNPQPATPCRKCGIARAKSELVIDCLIVAVAELQQCTVLYSFDTNMRSILESSARLPIREPAGPSQLPLFSGVSGRVGTVAKKA
ncbi:PIN domain-containing protein [Myxococcota bacterium]|nr:PIN domain-containing protein [Myxococcota bacterium]